MRCWRMCLLCAVIVLAPAGWPAAGEGGAARLSLPPGFVIAPWARVPGARSLAVADDGTRVYVGTRESKVFAILDPDRDGLADEVITVAGQLNAPNGIAVGRDGALFVAEQHRIIRLDGEGGGAVVVPAGVLPDDPRAGPRYAGFGPDGRLYVAIGAPCDGCANRGFAGTIVRMRPDGHELQIFARGIRSVLGFDWHPATGQMFFTDDGADDPGDHAAPDELNFAPRPGLHFGASYGSARLTLPVLTFEAHSAVRGVDFYEGTMFPPEYRHDAFVAQHGSGDRGDPVGHRIMRVRFEGDLPVAKEVFIEGWRGRNGDAFGRPVDLEELPDGSLLISDDVAGMVYRVTYRLPSSRPRGRNR